MIRQILYPAILLLFSLQFISLVFGAETFFKVQSVDTMKFSRDLAREKLKDLSYDKEIESQVRNIAEIGASHIAVSTPYDEEFYAFLARWVKQARKYKLGVWFRGNWSGWEGWFDYAKINREQHINKTREFVLIHPDLFQDGDIFTPCPECENGGPGDPRFTRDVDGFRLFLIQEYRITRDTFKSINKKVASNYYSMNGDVARLIMDKDTTKSLGGIVTVDHYVKTVDRLIQDVEDFNKKSGGEIILGEFGAPIPDIHGNMTEGEQADWVEDALKKLVGLPYVAGINYWTSKGSSTQLWNDDNSSRKAVSIIAKYFKPTKVYGTISDELGNKLDGVLVKAPLRSTKGNAGEYSIPVLENQSITFSKEGYISVNIDTAHEKTKEIRRDITLKPSRVSFIYNLLLKIKLFFKR